MSGSLLSSRTKIAWRSLVVAVILVGCFERFWFLAHVPFNSDEAIVLLQAQSVLHGHFVSFYWGQFYGAGQPYIAAPLVAIFGAKVWVIRGSSIVLSALGSILVWRIARRVLDHKYLALLVGALSFSIPLAAVMQMSYAYGFRPLTYVCALATILLAIKATVESKTLWFWALLGLVAGIGWWSSPEVVWGLIPAGLVVANAWWPHPQWRRVLKQAAVMASGFVTGAFVWIWVTIASSGSTLKPQPAQQGVLLRFAGFFRHTLPQEFGFRVYSTGSYTIPSHAITWFLYGVALVFLGSCTYGALRAGGVARALGITVVLSPVIYALNPATWYWLDGRYALFLGPLYLTVIAIGIESFTSRYRRKPWARLPLVTGILVAISLAMTVATFASYSSSQSSSRAFAADNGSRSAALALVSHGVTAGWADYWLAYRLDAFTNGQLHLSPIPGDLDRIVSDSVITNSHRPAIWIFRGGGSISTPQGNAKGPEGMRFDSFERQLRAQRRTWDSRRIAGLWVIIVRPAIAPSLIHP